MQTYLRGRDLIGDLDFSKDEVETVLDVAFDLKRRRALSELHPILRDKVLAMLFFFSSTRTRGSFEAGMAQLGGHAAFIESRTTQIAHGDTPKEIGEIFGRYFDGIAIRHVDWGVGNKYLNEVAKHSRVPGRDSHTRVRWSIHLLLLAAYPIVIGVAGWGRAQGHQPALGHGARGLLLVSGGELLIFAVVFGLAWLASRASRDQLLLRWRGGFWTVPLGLGYSVLLRLGVALVVSFISALLVMSRTVSPKDLQNFFAANSPDVGAIVDISALRENPVYFWLTVTVVSFVIGGFREELWRSAFLAGTRVVWPGPFASTAGQFGAVGLAALIFGFGHLAQGPLAVGFTAILGFGLGTILVLHRSIWPAVLAHGFFDATSLALLPWIADKLPRMQ